MKLKAVHNGTSDVNIKKSGGKNFYGLSSEVYVKIGAKIMLNSNLCVK